MNRLKLFWHFYKAKQNTTMSSSSIKAMQDKKLRNLLKHAYNHSEFYRKSFHNAGITAENLHSLPLSAFPTIDKKILLENFDSVVTSNDVCQKDLIRFDELQKEKSGLYKDKYHIVHSSGSTGKPGYFVYDEKAWDTMLIGIIRAALWDLSIPKTIQLLANHPRILYVAATEGLYGGTMAVGDGVSGLGAKQLHLNVNEPISNWITSIADFCPNIIIGYPSAIKILAELFEEGKINLTVSRIISCGEPLGMKQRKHFESVFRCKVLNFYGASESLALGVEETANNGMILFDDMNIIESVNGAMYLTSLYNFSQPLIRYRLSDNIVIEAPNANACCRFSCATGLIGRKEDILWFEQNGHRDFLHPLSVEGLCVEGLADYQFKRLSSTSFEMIAEISEFTNSGEIESQIRDKLNSILNDKGLGYVQYGIQFTNKILPDPTTGKKRLIISDKEKERMNA